MTRVPSVSLLISAGYPNPDTEQWSVRYMNHGAYPVTGLRICVFTLKITWIRTGIFFLRNISSDPGRNIIKGPAQMGLPVSY
jgi:hypothetical protein